MMTKQLSEIWTSSFGNEYTQRNSDAAKFCLRAPFWQQMIQHCNPKKVLEVGCNLGGNLRVLNMLDPAIELTGIEPNRHAVEVNAQAAHGRWKVVNSDIFSADLPPSSFDLVFTTNVLIHIAPADLLRAMKQIVSLSSEYVLAAEYYWPTVKEVPYRGLQGALWKQDFGALYLQNFKELELIETGYLGAQEGFDRSTWWLFKKTR